MMSTSMLTVVLVSASLVGQTPAPTWENSYSQAMRQGATQRKPVAVVFGSGANGWTKIAREATPIAEIQQLLSDKFVCVYVDTNTNTGKKLAQDFGIKSDVGMVISDRTGSFQAFWYQGDLTNEMLARYLRKYGDPRVEVNATEVLPMTRTSFYPGEASSTTRNTTVTQPIATQQMQPVFGRRGRVLYYRPVTVINPVMQPSSSTAQTRTSFYPDETPSTSNPSRTSSVTNVAGTVGSPAITSTSGTVSSPVVTQPVYTQQMQPVFGRRGRVLYYRPVTVVNPVVQTGTVTVRTSDPTIIQPAFYPVEPVLNGRGRFVR